MSSMVVQILNEKLAQVVENNRLIHIKANKALLDGVREIPELNFNGVDFKVDGNYVYFCNSAVGRELFSIQLWHHYDGTVSLSLSYYGTSEQSAYEYDRLMNLGKVAAYLVSGDQRLLELFKACQEMRVTEMQNEYKIKDEITKLEKAMREENLDKVMKVGTAFNMNEVKRIYISQRVTVFANRVEILKINKNNIEMKFIANRGTGTDEEVLKIQTSVARDIIHAYFYSKKEEA